jgi:selenium-binding protein 1
VAKLDVNPKGGMQVDRKLFLQLGAMRPHQVRLENGDSSSDSFCFS